MSQDPDISNVEPAVRTASAAGMTQMSSFVKDLYYIAIIDLSYVGLGQVLKNSLPLSIGPASAAGDNLSPEYAFRLPPRVHEMGEPFATSITMTQNGGKYIESQGSPIKDIRISGTTGFRPHRNDPNNNLKLFGVETKISGPIAQAISIGGLGATPNLIGTLASIVKTPSPFNKNESIGHDDIIFLRNLFRLYAWHKENDAESGKVAMLWRNIKDADYWIVEPQNFHINQSSSSPLTYEYSIDFKTLARWDHKIDFNKKDPLKFSKDVRSFIAHVEQGAAVIRNSFLVVANQIDRLSRLPLNATNVLLDPMVAVLEGATAVRRSEKRFDDLFRASLIQCRDNIKTYLEQVVDLLPGHDIVINQLRKAKRAAERILADPEMQPDSHAKTASDDKQKSMDAYMSAAVNTTPGLSGTSSFIGNQSLGQRLGQAMVQPGDNIRSIAGRLLGDRAQYHSLIVLNSLQYPFISPVRSIGVLAPGDQILYPLVNSVDQNESSVISSMKKSTKETDTVNDLHAGTSVVQAYGRDMRLTVTREGISGEQLDITPNQDGDISTIMGIPNVAQAVKLKFSTTRGELPMHPFFGAAFPIGTKATPATMAGFRIDVEQTLKSDNRITDIRSLRFVTTGDVLAVNAAVTLASTSSAVNLKFPVRKI